MAHETYEGHKFNREIPARLPHVLPLCLVVARFEIEHGCSFLLRFAEQKKKSCDEWDSKIFDLLSAAVSSNLIDSILIKRPLMM